MNLYFETFATMRIINNAQYDDESSSIECDLRKNNANLSSTEEDELLQWFKHHLPLI
jgi:hypothetical protein